MPTKLLYGQVQRSAMNWPFFCATELDLFANENLVVEARIFTSPPEPVAALIDGSLDLINVIPDVALLEMVKGTPLAIIANTNTRPQYRLMGEASLKDCSDLRGKKVGVNDGRSAETLILKKLLRGKGLAPDSYELTASGPPPQRCEKLKQGLLAGTMVTQPFDFVLEEEGFKSLASSLEVVPHYPFTVCVVRREEEPREEVVCFLKSLKRAWNWLADPANRHNAVAILSRATDTTEAHAHKTYDLYLNPPTPPSLAPTVEGIDTMLDLLAADGRLVPPIPPPQKSIDERYFKRLDQERH